ncbi:hypothetical protein B447_15626 [Thauera sp. 27]|nr:hypothetical protein B447_15626 [Thauera sp. 27]
MRASLLGRIVGKKDYYRAGLERKRYTFSPPQLVDGLLRGNVERESKRRELTVVGIQYAYELELITKDRLRDLAPKQLGYLAQCRHIFQASVEGECPHTWDAHVIDLRELQLIERDRLTGRFV